MKTTQQTRRINGIAFLTDEKGFVPTKDHPTLGHLEDCIATAKDAKGLYLINSLTI